MTYREKALELLTEKMQITGGVSAVLIDEICETYKPSLFGVLNAPDELEDWDTEIPLSKDLQAFKDGKLIIKVMNETEYQKLLDIVMSSILIDNMEDWDKDQNPADMDYPFVFIETPENGHLQATKTLNDALYYYGKVNARLMSFAGIDFTHQSDNKEAPRVPTKEPVRDVAQKSRSSCETMLTISTAHITPEVANMLEQEPDTNTLSLSVFPKGDYGWMIYVPEYSTESTGIPCLDAVMDYAKGQQCEWLCLDQDGPVMDDLQTYDWENTIELD